MFWKGKKVLVTGACGFIGSHLAERLVVEGADVKALVQYNSFNHWGWLDPTHGSKWASSIDIVAGDVRDRDQMGLILKGREVVFHLAALIAIPYSYQAPSCYVDTNVSGTLNILQGARAHDIPRVVHTSTSEVYGTAQYAPIDEKHPLQGQSPYSASKIGADMLAESFFRSFDLNVVTVRPFNTYGPRQSARAFIPTILSQILSGQNEIRLGALSPIRDLTYVADTVAGFLKAAETPGVEGETINLGTGEGFSVEEVLKKLMVMTRCSARVVEEAQRVRPEKSEVLKLVSNNKKAQSRLGWKPEIGLEEGLRQTIAWFEENRHHYKPARYNV